MESDSTLQVCENCGHQYKESHIIYDNEGDEQYDVCPNCKQ